MARKRKIPKLTAEKRAAFDERTRRFEERMAERRRLDAEAKRGSKTG